MSKRVKKHGKIILVIGLTVVLFGAYLTIPESRAASIANRDIAITDSRPTVQGVIYDFEGDHSTTAVQCLELVFCTAATGNCGDATGMVATNASTVDSRWSGWLPFEWTSSSHTATRIIYTAATATAGGTQYSFAVASIANPTNTGTFFARAASYTSVECAGTATDDGVAAFAIVEGVTVSATVAETLTLTITGVLNADCDSSFGLLGGPDTTATGVLFGELTTTDTFFHACQDVYVATNGSVGFGMSGQETTNLLSGSNTIDDSTGDSAAMTETVTSLWETAGNNGFGYHCLNQAGVTCVMNEASSARQFACVGTDAQCNPGVGVETAANIMSNSTATTATSRVRYKVTISGVQPAGSYSNTVVYIATPTF